MFSPSLVYLEQFLIRASYTAGGFSFLLLAGTYAILLNSPCPTSCALSECSFTFCGGHTALPAAQPADPNHVCSSVGGAEEALPVATFCVWHKIAVRLLAVKTNAVHWGCLPSPDLSRIATLKLVLTMLLVQLFLSSLP